MIKLNGIPVDAMPAGLTPDSLQRSVFDALVQSPVTYDYARVEDLITEIRLRASIVTAARDLAHSGMSFKVFRDSKANPDYWRRNMVGGFVQRADVQPSDAINDIFRNGGLYGTECSTAMVIVWYKALLDIMPEALFNRLFPDIYLMNWEHLDRDMAIVEDTAKDRLPGDARYFMNPDVDPLTPEWQGENVFYLGDGRYFGHGIGITGEEQIVRALNRERKPNATREAFLMDSVKRQDYAYISRLLQQA